MEITIWNCWYQKNWFTYSSICCDLYVFALSAFDIVKYIIYIVSFLLFLLFLLLIHVAIIQDLLEDIWSTPICSLTTTAADLSWDISTSSQVWNTDNIVLKILRDHKFQWPKEDFRVSQDSFQFLNL